MKVLLLGEYSSFHRYLKEGLRELGVEVTLVANGDGWKQIPGCDIQLYNETKKGLSLYIEKYIHIPYIVRKLKNYDVVQLINPRIFPDRINLGMIKRLIKMNKRVYLSACGGGYANVKAYLEHKFDYYPYDFDKFSLNVYDSNTKFGRKNIKDAIFIENNVNMIIPILYEYSIGHIGDVSNVIPAAINVDDIVYKRNDISDKIVFFHGLNGEDRKGTQFIRKAMELLKEKYPNDVEIIIDGHMPFEKYVKVLEKTNVVVDQCLTYGYGINACISMAQGKVVMAPCRSETLNAFGVSEAPIIHIEPNVDQIFSQMEYLVHNRNIIPDIGAESRKYVERLHDYKKVAAQYIEVWKSEKDI
jgi:glycosyltransferase involved in cell wall biosynthesis